MEKTLILLSILTAFVASAQSIEINPNGGTNASAVLDLKSTTKGFLPPRMTNEQMRAIPSPAQGLLAFCTNCGTNANGEYYFYKGTAWVILSSTTVTSFTSIGAVSDVASSQGASVTADGVLNLAPANATKPGIITATDQTFGGVKTFSNGIVGNVTGNVTGNAATVTTNANLTGVVTSTGNATSIANGAISNVMLANGAVANLSGTNTGDQTLPTLSSLGAVASNTVITGATNTKITYDAKGLVTAGTAATTADIAESTDKKYVTDAQLTKINNTLGTNTGDNAVNSLYSGLLSNATHTGDVTGSTALTIADNAVTAAKIAAGAITDSKVTDVAASKITGILPVANGGTGATTLTANSVLLGNGISTLQEVAPGANGNVLTSNGTTWTSATSVPVPAGSTIGDILRWNGTSWVTLAPGTAGKVLKMSTEDPPKLVWGTDIRTIVPSFTPCGATISDIDNNLYNTVLIGSQCWMKENLRVTRYAEGFPLEFEVGVSNDRWNNFTTGAYSYDWRDELNNFGVNVHVNKYGYLYNWNAAKGKYTNAPNINEYLNICPLGWHVPTDAEWKILTDELGGASVAGGKMKTVRTSYWNSPNTEATNESGFSALPGGYRNNEGNFSNIKNVAFFWSASEDDLYNAWNREMSYSSYDVGRTATPKSVGASIRCLRND